MKKIILLISTIFCLVAAAGCSKENEEPKSTVQPVDKTVAVEPAPAGARLTLTYTAGANGRIDGAGTQTVEQGESGSAVTAMPEKGYRFLNWSDESIDNPRIDANVKTDLAVTAVFEPSRYTLAYTAGKNGAIDGATQQTVSYGGEGTPVKAIPDKNHYFAGWSDGETNPLRTDRMVAANLAVTANFAVDRHTLTYTAGENGAIDGAGTQKVDHGSDGSAVRAAPSAGYHFTTWSDGSTANPRTDRKVTSDVAVTADFGLNQYTLTYTPGEHGSIDGSSRQTVDHGADGGVVKAVAEKGYHFERWSDGVTTDIRTDLKITGDIAVTAGFVIDTYTVGGNVSGLVDGTRLVLQNKGGDDLSITANGEFKFANSLLDGGAYAVTVLTQPGSPNQVCTVVRGSSAVAGEDVSNIQVNCVPRTYTIGGTVFGLPGGDRVVLRNNAGDNLTISANGSFTFAKSFDDGSDYEIKVSGQPQKPNWTCDVENAKGVLAGNDVADINVACYVEAVLQATAGIGKIKLNWNSQDFNGASFRLCRAREDISIGGFSSCQDIQEGTLEAKVNSPHTASKLTNDIPYWFQLEVLHPGGLRTYSDVVMAMSFGGLNDSGIDWCADNAANRSIDGTRAEKTASCEALAATHPGQDAMNGRDGSARGRKLSKTGYGSAGFDFTKVCGNGDAAGEGTCPPNPSLGDAPNNWACTRDNVTGLTWEVKTDNGLRNRSSTYTWHNPDDMVNGGNPGPPKGGDCRGSDCDTHAFVQAVNTQGLCGTGDWRLPTRRELLSIVNNSRVKPAIDTGFFPNTSSSNYWSSSPSPDQEDSAWQVYFLYGEAYSSEKSQSNHVRLVRGRTVTFGLNNP